MTRERKQGKKMNSRFPACIGKAVSGKMFQKAMKRRPREPERKK